MHFRSRRLQALLGVPLEDATYKHFRALLGSEEAREGEDLDYKVTYAGPTKSDSIAVDIATFANSRGGVVVIGINDTNGVPSAAPGIDLTDGFDREIRTAVAARVSPLPVYDVKWLPEDPTSTDNPRRGIMLIAVPPSTNAPHFVSDPSAKGLLKCPVRIGSKKDWMTETQVAAAYRRRFTTAVDSGARLAQVESELFHHVINAGGEWTTPRAVLTVSLAAEMPGDFHISRDTLKEFQDDLAGEPFIPGRQGAFFTGGSGVGPGRFFTFGRMWERTVWAELHTDGAGCISIPLECFLSGDTVMVREHLVTLHLMSALRFLGRHAAERAGAVGTAVVSARILPDVLAYDTATPAVRHAIQHQLSTGHAPADEYSLRARVMPLTAHGANVGRQEARDAYGETVVFLDDLGDGQPLAAAAGELTGRVLQSYGVAEPRQIRPGGVLVLPAWEQWKSEIQRWAKQFGVETADV
jgi:hypothetical protein